MTYCKAPDVQDVAEGKRWPGRPWAGWMKRSDFQEGDWEWNVNYRTNQAMKAAQDARDGVNALLGGVPPLGYPELPGELLIAVSEDLTKRSESITILTGAFKSSLTFGRALLQRADGKEADIEAFKEDLKQFLLDLNKIPDVLGKLVFNSLSEESAALQLDDSLMEFLEELIDDSPNVAVELVMECFALCPNWQNAPNTLYGWASQIPTIDVEATACQAVTGTANSEQILKAAKAGKILSRGLSKIVDLVSKRLPKDLSVTGTVGVGAGTEVAGHPANVPLDWAGKVFEILTQAFEKYIEFYESCEAAAAQAETLGRLRAICEHFEIPYPPTTE